MNTTKTWIGLVVLLPSLWTLGGCSSDSDDDAWDGVSDSGAGAGTTAGAGGRSGSGAGAGASSGSAGASGSGSAADPNQPAAPGVPPTFIPSFPGSGTSGDDAPLTNGELCDYVPLNGAPTPNEITTCFFAPGDPIPAATMEQVLECVDGADVVHVRLTFNPRFVDNTYGANAIGWGADEAEAEPPPMMGMMGKRPKPGKGDRGHTFEDLYHSDHAEIVLTDENGEKIMQFKLDYISEDADAVSGYASLGVSGGDGEMILGDAAWLLDYQTSIETNLNVRGYSEYIVDSPATDENYTPNAATPEWDYRYVFEAWVDVEAFGSAGFGTALIESVHASPSKADNNTLEVEPGECPPDPCEDGDCPPDPCDPNEPDAQCDPGNPPDEPPSDGICDPTQVDVDCTDAGAPETPDPEHCLDNPNDPFCHVD